MYCANFILGLVDFSFYDSELCYVEIIFCFNYISWHTLCAFEQKYKNILNEVSRIKKKWCILGAQAVIWNCFCICHQTQAWSSSWFLADCTVNIMSEVYCREKISYSCIFKCKTHSASIHRQDIKVIQVPGKIILQFILITTWLILINFLNWRTMHFLITHENTTV